jgi:hypothetical protein
MPPPPANFKTAPPPRYTGATLEEQKRAAAAAAREAPIPGFNPLDLLDRVEFPQEKDDSLVRRYKLHRQVSWILGFRHELPSPLTPRGV